MKIQTLIIGEYQMSPAISFCLYQIPTPMVTPPRAIYSQQRLENQPSFSNYFCLEDLFAIFDLHLTSHDLYKFYLQYPSLFCKDKEGRSYVQTNLMADVALKHNICNLSDLCRLSEEDLLKGGAIPLLKMTTFVRLFQKLSIVSLDKFEPRPLDGNEWFFSSANNTAHLVKLEPISPTFSTLHHAKPSPRVQRLSSCSSSFPSSNLKMNHPQEELDDKNSSQVRLPKPSSLLLKRLAPKHGHKKNLTIMTPSYNEETVHGIQSAPLKRSALPPFQTRTSGKIINKVIKKSPPTATLKNNTRRLAVPATAFAISAPWPQTSAQVRFPSPPIVPSQQPAWSQFRQQQQVAPALKTATIACLPRTPYTTTNNNNNNTSNTSNTPNTHTQTQSASPTPSSHHSNNNTNSASYMTQKQKFLQPFEFLYDHIEQTRTLKSTLDDQIRRSHSLIQTLQSSSTMMDSLVRRQVRDVVEQQFEARLRECTERISRLEYRVPSKDRPISPSVSPSPTNNKEQDMLTQLMSRIDQLESKLVAQKEK